MAFESTVGRELGRAALQTVTSIGQTKQSAMDRMAQMQQFNQQLQQNQEQFNQSMQMRGAELDMAGLKVELDARVQAFNEFIALENQKRADEVFAVDKKLKDAQANYYNAGGGANREATKAAQEDRKLRAELAALNAAILNNERMIASQEKELEGVAVGTLGGGGSYAGLKDLPSLDAIAARNPNDPALKANKYEERKKKADDISRKIEVARLNQGNYLGRIEALTGVTGGGETSTTMTPQLAIPRGGYNARAGQQ